MATRTVHVSDISGEPDAATMTIGLAKTWYEVDLTTSEEDALQRLLDPYVRSGRRIGPTLTKKRVVPDTTVEEREKIRVWAKGNGYELAEYGRIPKKVFAAYNEAHPGSGEGR